MNFCTLPLSEKEIRAEAFGLVKKPADQRPASWQAARGTLFDQAIFGAERDGECACGEHSDDSPCDTLCLSCGVRIGDALEMRKTRFGMVRLAAPVSHPLNRKHEVSVIAVLPIAYREPLRVGDDLNLLYSGVVSANVACEAGTADRDAIALLARRVEVLFLNERLEEPRTLADRPLRSLSWYLLDNPERTVRATAVFLFALGVRLAGTEAR